MNLDAFTRGYIECALWAETDNSTPQGGEPFDRNYCIDDIAPAALEAMIRDCIAFQIDQGSLLEMVYANFPYTPSRAGHDFWLTRNRHGAGFWDRDLGVVGDQLTEACRAYGQVDLYVGDDGWIYA